MNGDNRGTPPCGVAVTRRGRSEVPPHPTGACALRSSTRPREGLLDFDFISLFDLLSLSPRHQVTHHLYIVLLALSIILILSLHPLTLVYCFCYYYPLFFTLFRTVVFFFCFAVVFLSVRVFSPPYTRTTIYNIIHIIRHHDTLYCFLFYFLSYTLHTTHIIYVHMSHIIRCTRTRVLYVCRLAWIFICSVLLDSTFFSDHAISRVPVIVFFQPYVIVRVHRGRTYLYVYIKYIFAYVQCVNVSIVYTSQ